MGSFEANSFGLYDMHGNVWEWCSDWYDSGYYETFTNAKVDDPAGPTSGESRVLRGGSWSYDGGHCRSAFRFRDMPGFRNIIIGFRVVVDSE